jgi:uroporphyrinogen-III synthase
VKALTVLNTRAREQAAELSTLLRAAHFEVIEAPSIAVEPAWDMRELETVRQRLLDADYAWVVLPSQNAAHALIGELRASEARIVCGNATESAFQLSVEVALERFSAAAALDALRPRLDKGQRVLMPRAAEGRDELLAGLAALGVKLDAPVAYRTVAVADAAARLQLGDVDVLALCSPSALASVAAAIPPQVQVACLGQTTADAARRAGVRVDAVASQTNMPALVRAIEAISGARV